MQNADVLDSPETALRRTAKEKNLALQVLNKCKIARRNSGEKEERKTV
jgi:hypothetical protein